jgi:hypothetical protein
MKRRNVYGSLLLCAALATSSFAGEVVRRGAALSKSEPVSIEKVLTTPEEYKAKAVVIEGLVEKACTNKGCWMQIVPEAGKPGMRVTFKDYAFFIPLNAAGMKAKAEGVASVKKLSKSEADHLSGEGATLKRNADGTANEVSFIASGVELTR